MRNFLIDTHPLIRFLRAPRDATKQFTTRDWESLVSSSRRALLLSKIDQIRNEIFSEEEIPRKVSLHLEASSYLANSQVRSVNWETSHISGALAPDDIPFILLKGAAYMQANLKAGKGRILSDIDIMVPKERLNDAERALIGAGWFPGKLDPYDQKYYREWMHELPPLVHLERGTNLDLHHTILPPTAILKPDANKLWEAARKLPDVPCAFVLSPVDMILHSATHLFHEGDLKHGLRDLVDIDNLIREFANEDLFWTQLPLRAKELDLCRPLYYALYCCIKFIHTPIPNQVYKSVSKNGKPNPILDFLMRVLLTDTISTILSDKTSLKRAFAEFSIFVRSHYLRMPMYLLVPHLIRKAFVSRAN